MEKPKIMYDSPEAAKYVENIRGWVSSTGKFYGGNESAARYEGSTHKICECGKEMEKYYTKCPDCRAKIKYENYLNIPYKEYDDTPTILWDGDEFFWDSASIEEWAANFDEEDRPEE